MPTGEPPYDWIGVRPAAKQLGIYYHPLYRANFPPGVRAASASAGATAVPQRSEFS